jgi:hypothetical protein
MKKRWKVLLPILLIVVPVIGIKIYRVTYRTAALSIKVFRDKQLNRTIISPHMEQNIQKDVNVLYCSTFQLSWNELKNLMKGDIKLSSNPETATYLNKSLSTKNDISENSYIAVAGYKKNNVEGIINDQLSSKFNNSEKVDFSGLADDDIIAYSYLYKNLQFEDEFESLKTPMYFHEGKSGVEVKAFGIKEYSSKNEKMGEQVELIDYKSDKDFIVRLKTKAENEELILAKVNPEDTLLQTIESVNNRTLNGKKEALVEKDVLMIPKFSFKVNHSFSELKEGKIVNDGFSDYRIAEAMQDMTFVLDERGAILEAKGSLYLAKGIPNSRRLKFDRPFLLLMKEKGAAYPYYAMWIENTELMAGY